MIPNKQKSRFRFLTTIGILICTTIGGTIPDNGKALWAKAVQQQTQLPYGETGSYSYDPLIEQSIQNEIGKIVLEKRKYPCNTVENCSKLAKNYKFDIQTSIHTGAQKIAEKIAQQIRYEGGEGLGATLLDNKTGQILALVNGNNESWKHNFALQIRQNGSVNKAIAVYAPAIEEGILDEDDTVYDTIAYKPDGTPYKNDEGYRYLGPIPLWSAIAQSRNLPAINLVRQLGVAKMKKYLGWMGITEDPKEGESLAIGGYNRGVTTAQTAAAYATVIGPTGCYHPPRLVQRIVNEKNEVIFDNQKPACKRPVFSEGTRGSMVRLLHNVIKSGTAKKIGQKFPGDYLFGKTGTSSGHRDHYLVVSSKDYTLAIWVGYYGNQYSPSEKSSSKTKDYFIKLYPKLKKILNIDATIPDFAT